VLLVWKLEPRMDDSFYDHPILNSPYEYPSQHWELDADGQPTNRRVHSRRRAEFITPIPKAKKRKRKADEQQELGIGGEAAVSTREVARYVYLADAWR
jgi:type III restriction enzyme